MRYTNLITMSAFAAVLGGGQALLAGDGFGRDYRVDVRVGGNYGDRDRHSREWEDLRRDETQAAALRADIARDRARLNCDYREGRRYQIARDEQDLARDEWAFRELMFHIERDRERVYREEREYGRRYERPTYGGGFGYRR